MPVRKLQTSEWRSALDTLSRVLSGNEAEIEVSLLRLGHQVEADWLPLIGIVYDPKSDAVEVALEGVDHIIYHPRDIYIDTSDAGLVSIEIVDSDDAKEIVRFREPLMLPAAGYPA